MGGGNPGAQFMTDLFFVVFFWPDIAVCSGFPVGVGEKSPLGKVDSLLTTRVLA